MTREKKLRCPATNDDAHQQSRRSHETHVALYVQFRNEIIDFFGGENHTVSPFRERYSSQCRTPSSGLPVLLSLSACGPARYSSILPLKTPQSVVCTRTCVYVCSMHIRVAQDARARAYATSRIIEYATLPDDIIRPVAAYARLTSKFSVISTCPVIVLIFPM